MLRVLVLLIHAAHSMQQRYQESLARLAPDAQCHLAIVNSPYGGLSSAYRRLGAELEAKGSLLYEVARYGRAPMSVDQYDAIVVASYSAGYKLVERLLSGAGAAEVIDGVCWIDSAHAALDGDGTASDVQLAPMVRHALRSKDTDRVCWISHTDVRTHGYASTTQVAQEIKRLCGMPMAHSEPLQVGPVVAQSVHVGGLRIASIDAETSPKTEHAKALTSWGDEWLGMCVAELVERINEADSDEHQQRRVTLPDVSLGERALAVALAEGGQKEIPGAAHNPRILEYLAGSMRGGVRIGGALQRDEVAWCAAAASWCLDQVALPGDRRPHQYRCSVREIWEDAIATGTAVGASQVRKGRYLPRPGDLAIMTRGGPAVGEGAGAFAATRGLGHVGRVVTFSIDGAYETWDGNVNDTWTRVQRNVASSTLVGFVAHPYLTETLRTEMATESELDGLRQLDGARLDAAIRKFNKDVEDYIAEINAAAGAA